MGPARPRCGGLTYGYDAGDNLTRIARTGGTTTTQAYDVAHQLTTGTTTTGPDLIQRLTYTLNADGNRSTVKEQTGALISSYGYDQANRLTSFGTGATYTTACG